MSTILPRKSSNFAADFQVERLDTRLSHSDNRLAPAIIVVLINPHGVGLGQQSFSSKSGLSVERSYSVAVY
ncbi:MAG: hypothetical protein ACI4AI_08830 [Paludibacteraceae bacterium]